MNQKLTKTRWFNKIISRWVYKMVGIKYGPAMLAVRGEWLFIGHEGTIYRIKPTFYRESPLDISIERYS